MGVGVGHLRGQVIQVIANQVLHRHIGKARGVDQRQPADGPHHLLELIGLAGIHRPVARVVRARGHFIGNHIAGFGDEVFHRQQANQVEACGRQACRRNGFENGA